jgi:hypothetical protein
MMRKKNKEVAETGAVPMCPIVDISVLWDRAILKLFEDAFRKARKAGDLEKMRYCKNKIKKIKQQL